MMIVIQEEEEEQEQEQDRDIYDNLHVYTGPYSP